MGTDKTRTWRSRPLAFMIYNLITAKGSVKLSELQESLSYVPPFKDAGISKTELLKALMYLELNGLVHVRRDRSDYIITLLEKAPSQS
ncbi:hypothetical protein EYM_07495 [Ignicoccus islandicus DSM 13165]|uniref:ArsR family transcriptional regulator n=1 Tax=Ignicoccus islandicus DSM 13165 TaxID=940295 RepID=A0A0U3FR19_9CREN|nr:hypothetical protein EYM_07495 [Ignicoccus islandicus DSM 13165]